MVIISTTSFQYVRTDYRTSASHMLPNCRQGWYWYISCTNHIKSVLSIPRKTFYLPTRNDASACCALPGATFWLTGVLVWQQPLIQRHIRCISGWLSHSGFVFWQRLLFCHHKILLVDNRGSWSEVLIVRQDTFWVFKSDLVILELRVHDVFIFAIERIAKVGRKWGSIFQPRLSE